MPRAASLRISASLRESVTASGSSAPSESLGTVRVTLSELSPPLLATERTVSMRSLLEAFLARNALAPRPRSSRTRRGSAKTVTITTFGGEGAASRRLSAPWAPITGISTSSTTTSGRVSSARATAPRPSAACPTTSTSPSRESISAMPSRTMAWSSARSSRMGLPAPPRAGFRAGFPALIGAPRVGASRVAAGGEVHTRFRRGLRRAFLPGPHQRQARLDGGPAPRLGGDGEGAPEELDPLAHGLEAYALGQVVGGLEALAAVPNLRRDLPGRDRDLDGHAVGARVGHGVPYALPQDHVELVAHVVGEVLLLALEDHLRVHLRVHLRGDAYPHQVLQGDPEAVGGLGLPELGREIPHQAQGRVGLLLGEVQLLFGPLRIALRQGLAKVEALAHYGHLVGQTVVELPRKAPPLLALGLPDLGEQVVHVGGHDQPGDPVP